MTAAAQFNSVVTIPVTTRTSKTGGSSLANPQSIPTKVQGPEILTSSWAPTDLSISSKGNKELFNYSGIDSSKETQNVENPVSNSVASAKSIFGAPELQVNCWYFIFYRLVDKPIFHILLGSIQVTFRRSRRLAFYNYSCKSFYLLIIRFLLDENSIPSKQSRFESDSSTQISLSKSSYSNQSLSTLSPSSTPEVDASKCGKQFANIVHLLRLVATRVEKAIAGKASLREFGDAILMYADLFLENVEISVSNAIKKSQEDVDRIIDIAENHWLVQPNRLERWIGFKEAELVMFEWMTLVEGVTLLADENQLKKELAQLGNGFSIFFFIPSLSEWSSQIAEELKNVDPFTTASQLPMEDPVPWHLNEEGSKFFDNIMKLSRYQMRNQLEQLKCYIAFEDDNNFAGHFTIYKGKKVVERNRVNLPIGLQLANYF